jgi:hypothetical protein
MAAITIDQRSALVLIDLQNGILALPTLLGPDDIKNRARRLAAAFRAHTLPVVRVKLAFSADGGDLPPGRALSPGPESAPPAAYSEFPEDFPPHPGDIVVVKRHWGAFTGTELDLQLRRRGVTQIVLAGISTSIGVESTAQPHAAERRMPCRPAAGHPGHQRIRPAARRRPRLRPQARRGRQRPDLHPQPEPHPRVPQFTRSSAACHQATLELADHVKTKIG